MSDDDDDAAVMIQADCLVVVCRARFTRWFMVIKFIDEDLFVFVCVAIYLVPYSRMQPRRYIKSQGYPLSCLTERTK